MASRRDGRRHDAGHLGRGDGRPDHPAVKDPRSRACPASGGLRLNGLFTRTTNSARGLGAAQITRRLVTREGSQAPFHPGRT
jgi:hypothetical protein